MNDLKIEFFSNNELKINRTTHDLVPPHILMTGPQADEIKSRYINNLPVLLKTDPISKFYGFAKQDIIRIERQGGSIAYRIVN
jgi:DNA-directed RNA polymerase I, II, and III subunit RPABC1